ncbi:MAG: hypothetical protein K2P35_02675, partial [Lachnospiraceae bacterium]|nr:hypothetical protein [Lachnospiraceae bacterium]
DWIGTLLKKISDKTSKLIDKVDKFYSWQKKNSMINRAVKATDKEINKNQLAYQAYMKKADSVGLGLNYVRKVHNGTLSIEDVTDEKTASKIDKYSDWYDKAQGCLDTIEDLYDRQRDLIRQKLQNKLDSGKTLSKSEQKRYDSYAGQLDGMKAQGQSVLDRLRGELAEAEGTAPKQSEADRIKGEIDSIPVRPKRCSTELLRFLKQRRFF